MERISTSDHLFHDGDPFNNIQGTAVTAEWLNSVQEEIAHVIEAAGLTLDPLSTTQLLVALGILQATATTQLAGDNSTKVATDAFVFNALGGIAWVNVAGNTDKVLAQVQWGCGIVILTGALTGNINVVFPAQGDRWVVSNRTSGNFTVTCKTAAGTGVVVAQGKSKEIYGDGNNINAVLSDLDSVALTGVSTAPTAQSGDSSTQISNTAFVQTAVSGVSSGSAVLYQLGLTL